MPQRAIGADLVITTLSGPGAVDALETFAVPARKMSPILAVHITSDSDPGDFEFAVEVSNDNVNFFPLERIVPSTEGTEESVGINIPDFGFAFVKVSQYDKTNDVVSTVTMRLA